MKQSGSKGSRVLSVLFVALLIGSGCGGGGGASNAIRAAQRLADDAATLTKRADVDPGEFTNLSRKLDDQLAQVPEGSLTEAERKAFENASQMSAVLRGLATLTDESDRILSLISEDAMTLVMGRIWYKNPSAAFQTRVHDATGRLLRESACSMFSQAMSAESAALAPEPDIQPPPSEAQVVAALQNVLTAAGDDLSQIEEVVDLTGLSSKILVKARNYHSRISNTVEALSWQNAGAFRVYMRHCVAAL